MGWACKPCWAKAGSLRPSAGIPRGPRERIKNLPPLRLHTTAPRRRPSPRGLASHLHTTAPPLHSASRLHATAAPLHSSSRLHATTPPPPLRLCLRWIRRAACPPPPPLRRRRPPLGSSSSPLAASTSRTRSSKPRSGTPLARKGTRPRSV